MDIEQMGVTLNIHARGKPLPSEAKFVYALEQF
jgi:hypothetical protein